MLDLSGFPEMNEESKLKVNLKMVHLPRHCQQSVKFWEWRLHPQLVQQILERCSRANLHLLGSLDNKQCPLFLSLRERNSTRSGCFGISVLSAMPYVSLTLSKIRWSQKQIAKSWTAEVMWVVYVRPWHLLLQVEHTALICS